MGKPIREMPEELLAYIRDNFRVEGRNVLRIENNFTGRTDVQGYKYFRVGYGGRRIEIKAHHISWFLNHGEWPNMIIDHKDNDKTNNNPENLQLVTQRINLSKDKRTRKLPPNIRWWKNRYEVRVSVGGKKVSFGTFHRLDMAVKRAEQVHSEIAIKEIEAWDGE